ncbi:MAG: hypothetical protein Q4G59_02450, partial [Planctomycetia bacterium]|nr:hypothetical protein [Planctomycetia bacterium]
MTRRSNKGTSEQPGVSLFPFLAVLLCTMGMLVMLLVAIGQGTSSDHADDQKLAPLVSVESKESSQPEAKSTPQIKEPESIPEELRQQYEAARKQFRNSSFETVKSEVENSQWFLEELRGIHKRTIEALKSERDRLGSLETAMSTRFREIKQLRESVKLLQEGDSTAVPGEKELDKSIAETTQKIDSMKKEIESIKQRLADSKNSYAVVPHRGSSGTQRRPIYIECTKDAIRLMPEGIEFSVEDFLLAKSPANPFDTAIRTARTCYMNKYGQAVGEPYPLLIVRPGGADQYYAALAALSSWGGDYGYEFVGEDWKLEYPPADEEIASRVREQVAYARYKLSVPLAAMLANSPGLAERGFSSENEGTGFKTGVSGMQESSGGLFGENVRLSANAGTSRGTGYPGTGLNGTGLQGSGYRGTSATPGSLYANGNSSGLPMIGTGPTLVTGTGATGIATGGNTTNSMARGGTGTNALPGTSTAGSYNEASLSPGYTGKLVAGGPQSGIAGSTSELGQQLPAYEGQYKSAMSGQPQNATG